jgi:hypothetical protein
MADASYKWILSRCFGRMEDFNRAVAGSDNSSIGETNPFTLVLREEMVADEPVIRFVFAPVRVDMLRNFGGQVIGQAFHWRFHVQHCLMGIIELSSAAGEHGI